MNETFCSCTVGLSTDPYSINALALVYDQWRCGEPATGEGQGGAERHPKISIISLFSITNLSFL